MIAPAHNVFMPFAPPQRQGRVGDQQCQQTDFGADLSGFNMPMDDVLLDFASISQLLFGEQNLGGHFYPPLQLDALCVDDMTALGGFNQPTTQLPPPPPEPVLIKPELIKPEPMPAPPVTAPAPAPKPVRPASKPSYTRSVIVSPMAAAAAAAALKALPPSSTPQTKKRTHDKAEQQQKRRERNRVLAKRTRLRKKFMFQSLQTQVSSLHQENARLKGIVATRCGDRGAALLQQCSAASVPNVVANTAGQATALLHQSDFLLVKALQASAPSFCVTDPSLPDCPIVYASDGFIALTGYTRQQVLGRNCRFLQGPDTDPDTVAQLRRGIAEGRDTSVFLRNYNAAGESFWNHVFCAALRNAEGKIINYVGIQHKVSRPPAPDMLEFVMGDSDELDDDEY